MQGGRGSWGWLKELWTLRRPTRAFAHVFFLDFFLCVICLSLSVSLLRVPCRFHQSGRSIEKSSKSVDVPLCLNLAAYMTAPVGAERVAAFDPRAPLSLHSSTRLDDCWYHLYGIVSHGGGMGGGE